MMMIMGGEGGNKKLSDIQSKLRPLLMENAKVWTVANMIIYNLPFEYRVLASTCTDVVWQSILSQNVNNGIMMIVHSILEHDYFKASTYDSN